MAAAPGLLIRGRGLLRSLAMYYWPPGRGRRLDVFYGRWIGPGDLCFDIGAHAGNRSLSWLRLGARAVAVEPQPDFAWLLRRLLRRYERAVLVEKAVASAPGEVELAVSAATPTVSTASGPFQAEVRALPSFGGVVWERRLRVPAVTLDELIAEHGRPTFLKLDIEGMEAEALAGLSTPVPRLSFEFLAGRPEATRSCLDRIERLGHYRYNLSTGESLRLEFASWLDRAGLELWLDGRAGEDFSGDIYAELAPP